MDSNNTHYLPYQVRGQSCNEKIVCSRQWRTSFVATDSLGGMPLSYQRPLENCLYWSARELIRIQPTSLPSMPAAIYLERLAELAQSAREARAYKRSLSSRQLPDVSPLQVGKVGGSNPAVGSATGQPSVVQNDLSLSHPDVLAGEETVVAFHEAYTLYHLWFLAEVQRWPYGPVKGMLVLVYEGWWLCAP